jgi:hypothetical protein
MNFTAYFRWVAFVGVGITWRFEKQTSAIELCLVCFALGLEVDHE